MAGPPDQKNNNTHDTALGWLILFFFGMAVAWLIWYYQEYQIKNAFRLLRWAEMKLVSIFVDSDYTVNFNGQDYGFEDSMDIFGKATAHELDGHYDAVAAMAMIALKWPIIIIIGIMGLWAYNAGPGTDYRRRMTLETLMRAQSKTFPVILPFVKFDPSKQPPRAPGAPVPARLPLFAEALAPEEWVAYNRIPLTGQTLDESETYHAFSLQLGGRWRGPNALKPYKQILLAAFCLKAARKRSEADVLLGRLAACWSDKSSLQLGRDRGLLHEARSILRNKDLSGKVLDACNQHAFEATAMIRALHTARQEGGVLAPAQFLWLRGHDRLLWYPLNNLGRQAYHMEALGAMSHYKAERLTQRPIPKPKVDNAVISLTKYMASTRARAVPPLSEDGRSKTQKRSA